MSIKSNNRKKRKEMLQVTINMYRIKGIKGIFKVCPKNQHFGSRMHIFRKISDMTLLKVCI